MTNLHEASTHSETIFFITKLENSGGRSPLVLVSLHTLLHSEDNIHIFHLLYFTTLNKVFFEFL